MSELKFFDNPSDDALQALFANVDGGAEKAQSTNVGTNGFDKGQKFVIVGVQAAKIAGSENEFVAFACADGTAISVKQVMGLSSLQGFSAEEGVEFVNEFYTKENPEKQTEIVTSKGCDTPEKRFNPSTRNFYDFVKSEAFSMIGGTLVYLGEVIRQNTMKKKPVKVFGTQMWEPGYKRTQTAKLWRFIPASK